MEWLVILFFKRMLQILLRKLSQIGYNYSTKKPLTCLACLTRLWATKFLCLLVWENITLTNEVDKNFASSMGWPKEAREVSWQRKALKITSKSPSRILEEAPVSSAKTKTKALTAAKVSSSSTEHGRWLLLIIKLLWWWIKSRVYIVS